MKFKHSGDHRIPDPPNPSHQPYPLRNHAHARTGYLDPAHGVKGWCRAYFMEACGCMYQCTVDRDKRHITHHGVQATVWVVNNGRGLISPNPDGVRT